MDELTSGQTVGQSTAELSTVEFSPVKSSPFKPYSVPVLVAVPRSRSRSRFRSDPIRPVRSGPGPVRSSLFTLHAHSY
ncbi:unnamed protein product [Soboliphyme baturini]|uniref:Uncharacterized protein n=1 Tax=Soboliphyme baturini TaxID=241478 RepID=A0A183IJT8_9BILA|nr:unnamed protein product [Soboliphyme baturini]